MNGGAETLVTPALRRGYWGALAVSETGIYLIDEDALPQPTIEFYDFKTHKLTAVTQIENSPLDNNPTLDALAGWPHRALCAVSATKFDRHGGELPIISQSSSVIKDCRHGFATLEGPEA